MFAVLLERFYFIIIIISSSSMDAASLPSLGAQCTASPLSSLLSLHFHSWHMKKKRKKKTILRSSVTTVKRIFPNPCEVLHLFHPLRLCHRKAQKEKEIIKKKIETDSFFSFLFFLSFFFLIEWRKVEIKGFGTIFYSGVGAFLLRLGGKGKKKRRRRAGCIGGRLLGPQPSVDAAPTVLTARIREGGKYLLETRRGFGHSFFFFFFLRMPNGPMRSFVGVLRGRLLTPSQKRLGCREEEKKKRGEGCLWTFLH